MKLFKIAHSRSGDKGNISNISLIAHDLKNYEILKEKVTAVIIKKFLKEVAKGPVIRYELPQLGALNFVMYDALGGGVTKTLALDAHGKCLSQYLLEMDI